MRFSLILFIAILLVMSCATKQERARKLIDKANKLYPISQMVDTVLVIDTLIKYDTTVVIKVDSIPFTVKIDAPVNGRFKAFTDSIVFDGAKARIKASMSPEGVISFLVDVFPVTKYIEGEIRYRDSIKVQKELIIPPAKVILVKGLIWWFGLICGVIILCAFGYYAYQKFNKVLP